MDQRINFITEFIKSLSDYFEDEQGFDEIHLFSNLCQKIISKEKFKIQNEIIDIFKLFFETNFNSIENYELLTVEIKYRENIFINFNKIFNFVKEENKNIIWQYLTSLNKVFNIGKKSEKEVVSEENSNIVDNNMISEITPMIQSLIPNTDTNLISEVIKEIDNFIPQDLKENQNNLTPQDLMSKIILNPNFDKLIANVEKTMKKSSNTIDILALQNLIGPMMQNLNN